MTHLAHPHHAAALARAREIIDVTRCPAHDFSPRSVAGQWALLKSARGEGVAMDRLNPAHLIIHNSTGRPVTFPEMIDAARCHASHVAIEINARRRARKLLAEHGAA